jgi:hypothetical protein
VSRSIHVLLAGGLCLLASPALADGWDDTEAFYRLEGHSEALYLRARAFDRLAGAAEAKGLGLLLQRYKSPRQPFADEERFLIASSLRLLSPDDASQAQGRAILQAVRGRDPWLAYNVFTNWDEDALAAVFQDAKAEAWQRAAAIQALAAWSGDVSRAVETLSKLLEGELPKQKGDLHLLAGACGAALLTLQHRDSIDPEGYGDEVCRPLVESLMGLLQHPKLPDSSQALLARRLERFTRADADDRDEPQADAGGSRTRGGDALGPTTFMGITVEGRARIVFVIDMSDSMLQKLSGPELEQLRETARLRRRPVTGGGGDRGGGDAGPELPWDRIENRFDAARAFLARALRDLDPKASFAVVGFGDEAATLRATPKLVKASSKAVGAVIAELDGVRPGAATSERPFGTLRGQTNLHAAIRLAYRLSTKGQLSPEKCARPGNPHGALADTVFVLSDGEPTRDDFAGEGPERDVKAGTVTRVDPETGRQTTSQTEAGRASNTFEGPYRDLEYFRRELERLNLFRWAQVHVVGIGECDPGWGRVIAEIGEGEFDVIGGE